MHLQFYMEQILSTFNSFIYDNIIIYFIYSLVWYLVGGIDESIITLIVLQCLYVTACYVSNLKVCYTLIIKVYLIIIVGTMMDRTFNFNSSSLRMYLILYYSYNTLVDIINVLSLDDKFKIPSTLREIIKKIKRSDDKWKHF